MCHTQSVNDSIVLDIKSAFGAALAAIVSCRGAVDAGSAPHRQHWVANLEQLVLLGQVNGLPPPQVVLVDERRDAPELQQLVLLQLARQRQLIEVVVRRDAFPQRLRRPAEQLSAGVRSPKFMSPHVHQDKADAARHGK